MAWFRSARAPFLKSRRHAVAEVVLIAAMVCLMVVTAVRMMTNEVQSGLVDQAPSPVFSTRSAQP